MPVNDSLQGVVFVRATSPFVSRAELRHQEKLSAEIATRSGMQARVLPGGANL